MLSKTFRIGSCVAMEALFAVSCCNPSTCYAQTPLRERFLNEAPTAWAEVEDVNANVDVEVSQTVNNRTEVKQWTEHRQRIVKLRGELILLQSTDSPVGGKERRTGVDAVNDQRSFSLRREGDAPWTLAYVGPVDDAETLQAIDRKARRFILWPWYVAEWSAPQMVSRRGFHLEHVEAVQEGDETLPKVSFTFRPDDANNALFIPDGWMLLDPSRRWSIRRYEVHLKYPNGDLARVSVSNEYRGNEDAIPRSATMVLDNISKPRGVSQSIDFVRYERRLVPEYEFTMAAFGLPEAGAPSLFARSRLWMVLVAAGIACIVIAILLRRRAGAM